MICMKQIIPIFIKMIGSVFIIINSIFMSYAFIGNSLFGMGVEPDAIIRIIEIIVSLVTMPTTIYVVMKAWK